MLTTSGGERPRWWPYAGRPAVVLGLCLAYGHFRLSQPPTRPGPTVALIQGSIDITMKMDEKQIRPNLMHYVDLTRAALARSSQLDLIVWPETMFRYPWLHLLDRLASQPPADFAVATAEQAQDYSRSQVAEWTGSFGVPILLGIDTIQCDKQPIGTVAIRCTSIRRVLFLDRRFASRGGATTRCIA